MDLIFGSEDGPYLRLPDTVLSSEVSETFVKPLDDNLKEVRSKSRLYQDKLTAERVATTSLDKAECISRRCACWLATGSDEAIA